MNISYSGKTVEFLVNLQMHFIFPELTSEIVFVIRVNIVNREGIWTRRKRLRTEAFVFVRINVHFLGKCDSLNVRWKQGY